MSSAIRFAPHYTIEDYRLWQGDWELWNGLAIAMTPSPGRKRQAVLVALASELRHALRAAGGDATVLVELDWIVSNDTVVRPDVLVVCGDAPEGHLRQPPDLIAEVLSPSTRRNDLTYKRQLYADQAVGTYLIVDPQSRTIECLSLSPAGSYESTDASGRLNLTLCGTCAVTVESSKVFLSTQEGNSSCELS